MSGVSIKRPVKYDREGNEVDCGVGMFLRADCHSTAQERTLLQEAAACINLAPRMADALKLAVDLIGGDRPKLNLSAWRDLIAQWDAATGKEKQG